MSTQHSRIKVGIVGGAGYTAGELLRVLLHHPHTELAFVHSRSHADRPLYEVHTDLLGQTELLFSAAINTETDLLFLCLGHGESQRFLNENPIGDSTRIIDLSQDFRWSSEAFTYGLPEWNKRAISESTKIANPGCFATAIQLALLPLASKSLLHSVHVSGITGATGAGQKLQASSHFPWRNNNIQVYKALNHQHLFEIRATLKTMQSDLADIHFVPMRGDFARGIYVCAYTRFDGELAEARQLYAEYFSEHPFCLISDAPIDMKQTVNTNHCFLYLEKQGSQLIIHACLDNLLKGASGQAVQNMNLMFGLPETTGLQLKASAF